MIGGRHVLQQRIEAVALGRRRVKAFKRVRGNEQEGIEAQPDKGLRTECRQHGAFRQTPLDQRDCATGHCHDHHPHEHRALVVAPGTGDLEDHRLHRVRIVRHQQHREIGDHEAIEQAQERKPAQRRLQHRHRAHDCAQRVAILASAEQAAKKLQRGKRRSKPQCGKADFRDHSRVASTCWRTCSWLIPASSLGM